MTYGGLSDIAYQLGAAGRSLVEGFQRRPHSDGGTHPGTGPPAAPLGRSSGISGSWYREPSKRSAVCFGTLVGKALRFLRSFRRSTRPAKTTRPIAIIDSGLDSTSAVQDELTRSLNCLQECLNCESDKSVDPVGHGTRVVRILDRVVSNPKTRFLLASLGAHENVTSSAVAMAMTCCIDGMPGARRPEAERPFVVTMSLWPSVEGFGSLHQPLLVPFIATRYPAVTFVMAADDGCSISRLTQMSGNLL